MDQAMPLWAWWVSLVSPFAPGFTRPGWGRFGQWITGMVRCWEDPTLTQILTAMGLESRWRVLEPFAEYAAWAREALERHTLRWLEQERPARWGCYHPVAGDAPKRHRTRPQGWGTCPVHESSARSPKRAETGRAHHGVVRGELTPGRPWTSLPHAARRYCRQRQVPAGATFRTTTALAVELLRQAAAEAAAPMVGVGDGASAVDPVVRPGLKPEPGLRRIALVTRRRADARLDHPAGARPHATGRPPTWGPRIAAPHQPLSWPVGGQARQAWVDGRPRRFQYTQRRGRWAVSGPQLPVHVLVIRRAGYKAPWFLLTSALALAAAQVVEAWAGRFRQADGCRDHKQRLGLEEGRAWAKEPIVRPLQIQLVALPLRRLLQARLEQAWGPGSWGLTPEWNRRQRHASLLDLRRLFWRHRAEVSRCLPALEDLEKLPPLLALSRGLSGRAA